MTETRPSMGTPSLPSRLGRPLRRVRLPGALAALLAAVAVTGFAWALVVPPWEAPDEPKHFAYTQSLVERGKVPRTAGRPAASSEERLAIRATDARNVAGVPTRLPPRSQSAERTWRVAENRLGRGARSDGGGLSPAENNPPAYYVYEAIPYRAARNGDIFARLYAMRLWSALLLLATTTFTWLLAGELHGHRPLLQLTAAGIAGLQPMVAFLTASVNPDGAEVAAWAAVLWLGVRLLRRGASTGTAVALGVATVAAVAVKPVGWAVVPAAALALVLAAWRSGGRWAPVRVAGVVTLVAVLVAWVTAYSSAGATSGSLDLGGVSPHTIGGFFSYLGDFYARGAGYDTWVGTAWGAFAHQEVRYPPVIVATVGVTLLGVLAGGLRALIRNRRSVDLAVVAFLVVACGTLVTGLHWTDYHFARGPSTPLTENLRRLHAIPLGASAGNAFLRGRYLLPLVPVLGILVSTLMRRLPGSWAAPTAGAILGSVAALDLIGIALVAVRFYA